MNKYLMNICWKMWHWQNMAKTLCNSSPQEAKPIFLPLKLNQSCDLHWPIKYGGSDGMPVLSPGLFHCWVNKPRLACWRMNLCGPITPIARATSQATARHMKEATLDQCPGTPSLSQTHEWDQKNCSVESWAKKKMVAILNFEVVC